MGRDRRPRGARKSKYNKGPSEGGSGGKLGHSNQDHWAYTAEVKEGMRRRRRANDKKAVDEQLADLESRDACPEDTPQGVDSDDA